MDQVKVIKIQKSIYSNNDEAAKKVREDMKKSNTFLLNLMSSPGSGKTTTLLQTIKCVDNQYRLGVLEADIDSDVDAIKIAKTGVKTIQLHTGGMCHLDAKLTKQGLDEIGVEDVDIAVLENVGNLVCPASFDTGASKNAMILSVPEGDDKPLKYPKMFKICDALIVNKIDTMSVFDFDMELLKERVTKLNPNMKVFPISAKTGEGVEAWVNWLLDQAKSTLK
ncbi:MAG: hydrogenase nickel incorporation protein HypB [Pleomorphochaeta sp.]